MIAGVPRHPPAYATAPVRRAFTLIETMLAMILGAMVLAGCLGVFLSIRNMDSTFDARFQRTSELDITHTVVSRAMLAMQMQDTQAPTVVRANSDQAAQDEASAGPDPRARLILATDPTVAPDSTGWVPQRFELVCATPPVPSGLASHAAEWYTAHDQSDSLDFSAMDGSQGAVRGVFELRHAGQRERVMRRLGLLSDGDPALRDIDDDALNATDENPSGAGQEVPNWTLWWRPVLNDEYQQLLYGQGPYPDTVGSPEQIRSRLAGAVPLLRGVERCLWQLFKGDEYVDTYSGIAIGDLPAYAQFEVILNNSQYASWMFEVDWVLGDDPSEEATTSAEDEAGDENAPGAPGGVNNPNNRPGRPGGVDPDRTRTLDFSGGS